MEIKTNNIETNLNTDFLKLIAFFSMVCDHVGKAFFPNLQFLQIIGRIAFPIFAYCLVIGALYTRNIKKYMLRLLITGIISQPFFMLIFFPDSLTFRMHFFHLNTMFTLLFGLILIYSLMHSRWILFLLCVLSTFVIYYDYSIYGLCLITLFYVFRNKKMFSAIAVGFLLFSQFFAAGFDRLWIQGYAVLSMPFIYIKTNVNLKLPRHIFYFFYPAHLIIIYLIKLFL